MGTAQIFLLFFALYGIYAILFYTLTKILAELRDIRQFMEAFCFVVRPGPGLDPAPAQEVTDDE